MKANELRIGNLVYRTNKQTKEKLLIELTASCILDISANGENSSFIYKPIPLTEEILLKYGFVSGGAKQLLFITLDKKDECYLYLNPLGKGIAIDQNGKECSFEIEFKYVHQLQNIFFALTNEELTTNLLTKNK